MVGKAFQGLHSWSFGQSSLSTLQDFNKIDRWKGPMSIVTPCKISKVTSQEVRALRNVTVAFLRMALSQMLWIQSVQLYISLKFKKTRFPSNAVTPMVFFSKHPSKAGVSDCSIWLSLGHGVGRCEVCGVALDTLGQCWPPMLACLVPLQSTLHKINTKQLNSSC